MKTRRTKKQKKNSEKHSGKWKIICVQVIQNKIMIDECAY